MNRLLTPLWQMPNGVPRVSGDEPMDYVGVQPATNEFPA